jgi:hypothetical protein
VTAAGGNKPLGPIGTDFTAFIEDRNGNQADA